MKNSVGICAAVLVFIGIGYFPLPLLSQAEEAPKTDSGPQVYLSTEVDFDFQKTVSTFVGELPMDPNMWTIKAEIKNIGAGSLETLPIYLYTESHSKGKKTIENARVICPKMYRECFPTKPSAEIRIAPTGLEGKISEGVFWPLSQLNEPPEGRMRVLAGPPRDFRASLLLEGKNTDWNKLEIPPKSRLNCTWEFWSPWAASEKTRTGKGFLVQFMGPVVRVGRESQYKVFIAVTTLEPVPSAKGTHWRTSAFELKEVKADLAKELNKNGARPSVGEFIEGVEKASKK